jgi:hypothetical protein
MSSIKVYRHKVTGLELEVLEYTLETFPEVLDFTKENKYGESVIQLNEHGDQCGLLFYSYYDQTSVINFGTLFIKYKNSNGSVIIFTIDGFTFEKEYDEYIFMHNSPIQYYEIEEVIQDD